MFGLFGGGNGNLAFLSEIKELKNEIESLKTRIDVLKQNDDNFVNRVNNIFKVGACDYNSNLNTLTSPGIYNRLVSDRNPNGPGQYGYLIVFLYGNGGNMAQVVFPYYQTDTICFRKKYGGTWTSWTKL